MITAWTAEGNPEYKEPFRNATFVLGGGTTEKNMFKINIELDYL